jgi:murein DD-endopeptidase MepM/ murein hydrolase activator NlpD
MISEGFMPANASGPGTSTPPWKATTCRPQASTTSQSSSASASVTSRTWARSTTLEQQQAEDYAKIIGELNQVQEKYRAEVENVSEAEKILAKARNEGKLQNLPAEYRKVIEAKAADLDATRALQDAEKRRFDALVAQINVDVTAAEKTADTNESLRKQLSDLETSTRKLGATKAQVLEIEQQDLDLKIESAEIDLRLAEIAGKSTAALHTQVDLLRQLKDARAAAYGKQQVLDAEQAGYETLKRQQEAAQKSADEINRALTDSLFRAAENGKNAFQTLRDSIHGMFNNMVLKPVVQAAFAPISGAISGATQGVTSAFGTSLAGSSAGSLLGGGSLFAGGISNIGANFAFSGLGQSLGLSTAAVPEAMIAAELTSAGSIAATYGSTADYLRSTNHLESTKLPPGKTLLVHSGKGMLYQVREKKGRSENLRQIAQRYNRSAVEIARANRLPGVALLGDFELANGSVLFLPGVRLRFTDYMVPVAWVPGKRMISSGFGVRRHPLLRTRRFHTGLDMPRPYGFPVKASREGTVIFCGWRGGYGKLVIIKHQGGLRTWYGHLSQIDVTEGQRVAKGHLVGRVGATGLATGPHLHFEVRDRFGNSLNPKKFIF